MKALVNREDGTIVEEPVNKPWTRAVWSTIETALRERKPFSVVLSSGATFSVKNPGKWSIIEVI